MTAGPNGQAFKRVDVNGAELAYADEGTGQPVVFVHGGVRRPHSMATADASPGQALPGAIAYSRRYAWPNEGIPDDVADELGAHAEDLADLIRALELGPAHLVGHSYGAGVCMIAAVRHPELARTLVLMEPGVVPSLSFPPTPQELLKLLLTQPRLGKAFMSFAMKLREPSAAVKRGDMEQAIQRLVDGLGAEPGLYDRLPADVKRHMLANSKILRSLFFGEGMAPFGEANVRRITQPTLLVSGERSPASMLRTQDCLARLFPNVQRAVVPNAAHTMQYQNSAGLNQAILSFLDRYNT